MLYEVITHALADQMSRWLGEVDGASVADGDNETASAMLPPLAPSVSRTATLPHTATNLGEYELKGLYMCGAGSHPGGGVTGLPGRNAAREIARDLGRRRG